VIFVVHLQAARQQHCRRRLVGNPGFVQDEYLTSLGPSTMLAVMDLVTSGYWERVDDGYRICDWDLTRWRWGTPRHLGTARRSGNRRVPAPSRTRY
jgi:hypothetical protein